MAVEENINHAVDAIGVYGHTDPDLDCLTAMWIVERFLLKKWYHADQRASFQFVSHHQLSKLANDLSGSFPIVVDGGKVYDPEHRRFDTHGDVRLKHECATSLVARELDEADAKALAPMVESVRMHDTGDGRAYPTLLPGFFRLLHGGHGTVSLTAIWHGVLSKWYGLNVIEPQNVNDALEFTKVYGAVVVTPFNAPRSIASRLFNKGYKFVVYSTAFGVGVVASLRLPFRFAQRLLEKLEEKGRTAEFSTWFFHPTGRMACRGSSKAPVASDSVLSTDDLVGLIHELEADAIRLPLVSS